MSLFQSNLRKQIRNLPTILNFVKIIHCFSKVFTGVLSREEVLASAMAAADEERLALDRADPGGLIVTSYVAFSSLLEKTMDDCLEFQNVEDVLNFVLRRP